MKKKIVTVILRSCLTGRAVWIYQGPSREAMQKAYQRACKKEIERMRNWSERMAQRTAHVGIVQRLHSVVQVDTEHTVHAALDDVIL